MTVALPHFSTEPSGERRERHCMVQLQNEPKNKYTSSNMRRTDNQSNRFVSFRFGHVCLAELFLELRLQVIGYLLWRTW